MKPKPRRKGRPAPPRLVQKPAARMDGVRAGAAVPRRDGLTNLATGLGGARDKRSYAGYVRRAVPIDFETLEAAYAESDLARRIVEAQPAAEARGGFTIDFPSGDAKDDVARGKLAEAQEAVTDALAALEFGPKVEQARVLGRLFGGAVIWPVLDDGIEDFMLPLDETKIKKVESLIVIERRFAVIAREYADPTHPRFGEPELYDLYLSSLTTVPLAAAVLGNRRERRRITTEQVIRVHESRVVKFPGAPTTRTGRNRNGGWDDSVLVACWTALLDVESVWASTAHLLQDVAQATMTIKGFMGMIAGGKKDLVRARMEAMDIARSVARIIPLDVDEKFERHATPLTTVDRLLELEMQRLAAAGRMSSTLLWGMSPSGMNATGESDTRNWYDQVAAERERDLRPGQERIVSLVLQSTEGPTQGKEPEGWELEYPPLWQPTAKEEAETEETWARAGTAYIDRGVFRPEEVAISRGGPGTAWKADLKSREEALDPKNQKVEPRQLSGIQTQSASEIIDKVWLGTLPRSSAVGQLSQLLGLTVEQADVAIGKADPEFAAKQEAAAAAAQAPPPQASPPDDGEKSPEPEPKEKPEDEGLEEAA